MEDNINNKGVESACASTTAAKNETEPIKIEEFLNYEFENLSDSTHVLNYYIELLREAQEDYRERGMFYSEYRSYFKEGFDCALWIDEYVNSMYIELSFCSDVCDSPSIEIDSMDELIKYTGNEDDFYNKFEEQFQAFYRMHMDTSFYDLIEYCIVPFFLHDDNY